VVNGDNEMNNNEAHTKLIRETCMLISMYPCIKAFSIYNGGVYSESRHTYLKTGPFHPKGIADIMVHSEKVKTLYIECKTGEGVQSSDQKDWQGMCEQFKIPYTVIHEKHEALQFLRKEGVIGKELEGI
jgi:hypothetical protein